MHSIVPILQIPEILRILILTNHRTPPLWIADQVRNDGPGCIPALWILDQVQNDGRFCENLMVGEAGFEPARFSPHAPKACASAIPPLPLYARIHQNRNLQQPDNLQPLI